MKWDIFFREKPNFEGGLKEALLSDFPTSIWTQAPGLTQPDMPPEVALLLPSGTGASGFIDLLTKPSIEPTVEALGLFLADPFLSVEREAPRLRSLGIKWIASIPTVDQYGIEFTRELKDVGLDRQLELENLRRFKAEGFSILASTCSVEGAPMVASIDPHLALALPIISDFAAGFPSPWQRWTAAQAVQEGMMAEGWRGPLLAFGNLGEVSHESQWPSAAQGLVCRPTQHLLSDDVS